MDFSQNKLKCGDELGEGTYGIVYDASDQKTKKK
jgi:hypothetical protein